MINANLDQKNWYVLITKSNCDKKTALVLQNLGFSVYIPLQRQIRYWSDRKKSMNVPVLSPYMFLNVDEKNRKNVFQFGSIVQFLIQEGKPATVKDEEIENIRILCNYSHNLKIEHNTLKRGDFVEVISGPLSGMRGYAYQENGHSRLGIQIKNLGYFANVEVDSRSLRSC